MNVTKIFDIEKTEDLKELLNSEEKYKSTYMTFDTSTAVIEGNKYKWSLQVGKQNDTSGVSNVVSHVNRMKNIIGIRLSPTIANVAHDYDVSTDFYGFVKLLLIDEFKSQSAMLSNGTKFHFMLTQTGLLGGDRSRVYPHLDGYFWFKKPFTSVDSITITVYNLYDYSAYTLASGVKFFIQFIYEEEEVETEK